MKRFDSCILKELSHYMAQENSLKAVWLDNTNKNVSLAFAPNTDTQQTRHDIEGIISHHQPDEIDDCPIEHRQVACDMCEKGMNQSLPPRIRLLHMPDSGVLIEKETCPTSSRFWKWEKMKWLKFKTRGSDWSFTQKNPHLENSPPPSQEVEEWKQALIMAIACGVFAVAGFLTEILMPGAPATWSISLYVIAYILGAWHPAEEVWELIQEKTLDVHFLMLCVAVGAAFIGHWWEGAILLFLFSLSGALEHYAMARTEKEINSLFKDSPKEATILENGIEKKLPVEELKIGMHMKVRPDEQFPVDGIILQGKTAVDESNLTGEAIPVEKQSGSPVYSGTLNTWGSVECEITKLASESALAKIIKLIQEAQKSKAPSQKFTDQFGTRYTYFILFTCTVMFFVWWFILQAPPFISEENNMSAFYRAMTLLVVASPCALVLSIPSAILAGIASGARQGILFRGGSAIEKLAEIDRIALDKTGTLTTGNLKVEGIDVISGSENKIKKVACSLALHSNHPVSRNIADHFKAENIQPYKIHNLASLSGMGVEAHIQELKQKALLGRRDLIKSDQVRDLSPPKQGQTEVLIQCGDALGRILLRDQIRTESKKLVLSLKQHSIKVSMLTGDREPSANFVAREVELDDYSSELKPDGKVKAIMNWSNEGEKVAMVGDGVNDAPALASSHISMGMGMRGSDAVLEIADVVLMKDKLENVLSAYRLSKRARSIIHQNLLISLGVIVILVASALGSFIPLTLGVIGHEGSTVIVVMNSLRLLFIKDS